MNKFERFVRINCTKKVSFFADVKNIKYLTEICGKVMYSWVKIEDAENISNNCTSSSMFLYA